MARGSEVRSPTYRVRSPKTSDVGQGRADRAAARRRLLARFWVMARAHRISDATLSEIVSLELGRRVVVGSGFGLSRLPVRHLARAVEMVGRFVRRPRSEVRGREGRRP